LFELLLFVVVVVVVPQLLRVVDGSTVGLVLLEARCVVQMVIVYLGLALMDQSMRV
jgi:hypothetical protein